MKVILSLIYVVLIAFTLPQIARRSCMSAYVVRQNSERMRDSNRA